MCALCDGRSMAEYVRSVEDLVDRHGWALQYVDSSTPDSYEEFGGSITPAFCYTVGLTALGHPEIVITGRAASESASVLNALARRVAVGDDSLRAGIHSWAAGFDLYFVDVAQCEEWLVIANRLYSPGRVRAIQAVWRDAQGNLPWEGDVVSTIVQPILGPPPGWLDDDI